MPAAPISPPTLNRPWKPDIAAFCRRRSTSTACAFIETSSAPSAALKYSSAATSSGTLGASANAGNARHSASALATMTVRAPRRWLSSPPSGIASTEPAPKASSTMPSRASSSAKRALT